MGHDVEVRFRLSDRDPGLQAPEQEPVARERAPLRLLRPARLLGHPEVGVAPGEARRHDADQRSRRAVEHEAACSGSRSLVEAGDPRLVAQDEDRRRARLVVRRLHHAAEERGHAEELEGARRDQVALEPLRALAGGVEDVLGLRWRSRRRTPGSARRSPGTRGRRTRDGRRAPAARVVDLDRHQPLASRRTGTARSGRCR